MSVAFKCHFVPRIPKFPKLGLVTLWRAITFCIDLWLRWGFKQSCNHHWKLSNDMWHATYKQLFQSDSWLLMGRSQIGTLTSDLSFEYNLCFKYSNGSCKLILNIYVSRALTYVNLGKPHNVIWSIQNLPCVNISIVKK
jgi:hypothetical protein